jgi:very-short-patch-repair endonuclease
MSLRGRGLEGLRFRRQHPVGPFVLDFYCDQAKLALEVDGAGHWTGDQPARDQRRDALMAGRGIFTLRIEAIDVRDDLDGVLARILTVSRARIGREASPPSPASPVLPP